MVSFVPLSADPAEAPADGDVVEFELHAASDSGTARASSTAIPRRRLGGVVMRGSFVGARPHRSESTSTLRPKRWETGFAKVGGTREGVNRRYAIVILRTTWRAGPAHGPPGRGTAPHPIRRSHDHRARRIATRSPPLMRYV